MDSRNYKSKIDRWVYAVIAVSVCGCFIGPMLDSSFTAGIILGTGMLALELFCITGVRYRIEGGRLGICNLHRWTWYPIDKISSVRKTNGILATAAMSMDRVEIRFTDHSVTRSYMPLVISPADRDGFIADLKRLNPDIEILK